MIPADKSGFHYRGNRLYAGECCLVQASNGLDTPFYVYAPTRIEERLAYFRHCMAKHLHSGCNWRLAAACKANDHLAILHLLARLGAGLDVVSLGEMERARAAGFDPARIVYSGVGKTAHELNYALQFGVGLINVESDAELAMIAELAAQAKVKPRIALRVNPEIGAPTHKKIATGGMTDKFGFALSHIEQSYARACALTSVDCCGLSVHIGSQIMTAEAFHACFKRLNALTQKLRAQGLAVKLLDLGGGLGVAHDDKHAFPLDAYAQAVASLIAPLDVEIIFEPGRWLLASAGALITRVIREKTDRSPSVIIFDAGMSSFMRPAIYDAWHPLSPLEKRAGAAVHDIVGPLCESGDVFERGWRGPPLQSGDLCAIRYCGAYGRVLANCYNAMSLPAEYGITGKTMLRITASLGTKERMQRESMPDAFCCNNELSG